MEPTLGMHIIRPATSRPSCIGMATDITLDLKSNEPGKIQFTATIAGRFPLEVHRFGTGTKAGRSHITGPLLYVEVLPR